MRFELSRRALLGLGGAGAVAAASALSGCSYFAPTSSGDALRYTFWGDPEEKVAVEGVIARFAATSGVPAVGEHIPDAHYMTKMNALVAGNIEPDCGYLQPSLVMRFGESGLMSNVLEWRDRFPALADLRPGAIHQWAPGKAIMQNSIEVMLTFFDRAVLDAEGVAPPTRIDQAWDWDAFVATADRLTVDSSGRHPSEAGYDPGSVVRYGVSGLSVSSPMYNLLVSNGCPIFDEDGTHTLFSTAAGLEVVQNIYDLIHTHRVSPSPAQMQSVGGDVLSQLVGGRVAMVVDGQWNLLALSESGLDHDVALLPRMQEPVVLTQSGGGAVFATSENLEGAWGVTAALADPALNLLFRNGLWMPLQEFCYRDENYIAQWIAGDAYPAGYREACIDATREVGQPLPAFSIRNWDYMDTQISTILSSAWTGEMSPKEACRAVDDQLEGILHGRYLAARL